MHVFRFRPIGVLRMLIAGFLFFLVAYATLRFGFGKSTATSLVTAAQAGAIFGAGLWFAMSLLGDGGAINTWAKRLMGGS